MSISIPLKKMSFEEKIQVMEMIWDDLCHSSNGIESPAWHKDVLVDRELALKLGTDEFVDWETTKKEIKKEIE